MGHSAGCVDRIYESWGRTMALWTRLSGVTAALALAVSLVPAAQAQSVERGQKSGTIEWGLYVDPDGCMHWWADGGVEGYMVSRLNPKTGKPVCLKKETCYVGPSDTLFATDSALLNRAAELPLPDALVWLSPAGGWVLLPLALALFHRMSRHYQSPGA